MNNSAVKQLIRSKGFVYANGIGSMRGMLAIIKPDNQKSEYVSNTVLAWLQHFNDVVIPSDPYTGYYPGDQVQIFHPAGEYSYWGQFGRVKRLSNDEKLGRMATIQVAFSDDEFTAEITLKVCDISVIGREGVVNLQGMTPSERDAVIMQMQGISEKRTGEEFVYTCECRNDECELELPASEWEKLESMRDGDDTLSIVSKDCRTLNYWNYAVMNYTENLRLVKFK